VREKRTAKNPLPGSTLPCARCRASAHGKGFAVRFPPFAVPFARTAKHCSPVVDVIIGLFPGARKNCNTYLGQSIGSLTTLTQLWCFLAIYSKSIKNKNAHKRNLFSFQIVASGDGRGWRQGWWWSWLEEEGELAPLTLEEGGNRWMSRREKHVEEKVRLRKKMRRCRKQGVSGFGDKEKGRIVSYLGKDPVIQMINMLDSEYIVNVSSIRF
jgi:hypothetical protein